MEVSLEAHTLRFARPLTAAYGSLRQRELLLLTLSQGGLRGRGEAAPLEPYDGVSMADVGAALAAYQGALEASEDKSHAELLAACRVITDLPQALAAVDVALWELEARRAGIPLAALLTDHPASQVTVSATVDASEPAAAADAAARAARQGFRCLKMKVGAGGDDLARAKAVRSAVGPQVALRLDANGAWSPEQAVGELAALGQIEPELVEEPVHGLVALRQLRTGTQLALAIDETAGDPDALKAGVADAVCLKLSRCGGISRMLQDAAVARAGGSRVYLGSTYDGPLGIAAALHAAAALGPDYPCGLATLELFEGSEELPASNGEMTVPTAPGLGI